MKSDNLVRLLPWDSDFFGVRIASINGNRLNREEEIAIQEWCRDNRIDCLYFLADPSDTATIRVAEESGFHLVDIRVTLDRKISAMPSAWQPEAPSIRLAVAADIQALRPIAAVNHRDSRFYHDGGFSPEWCDELYAIWIEKSCTGFADAVLVPAPEGTAAGYLSCHLRDTGIGQIGLVGVNDACQGKGLGQQLLDESLRWFAAAGVDRVEVVTQGRNIAAQRLYQRRGFMTKSVQLWYHKWFSQDQ
jgi:dTDP-4-amino-4,6-dideoxy-D-galactose acyltransferase